ncbi:metal ABC transporter solute-binding protein [Lactiplantibacillus xiangfangensis]|uniref:Abc superfamily atp binding cassette transporter, binding protein n=1 Tax=Lactiplantibacillus xiangfangensis TaxID=942150 RepID=A0A0R2M134_9LACO|nr:metal ABC transporter solute-binding protein [Lactiplantibacillus xiangfangensis]KRO07775.1 abc superfamily atp binding cassette transporter, binding protein [Lactiplantibacillus xiangfangensis]
MFKGKVMGVVVLSLLVGGLTLSGCRQETKSATGKIKVVTTTNFYGEMARAVGGNRVKVQSIINQPSVDPHDYEPTPDVAKAVANADIAVANGIGYDGWMNKLVKAAPATQLIRVGEDVMHEKAGANEHLWYNVKAMPAAANYLAQRLAKKDPQHRKTYQQNAKKYVASLQSVTQEAKQLRRQVKQLPNRRILVSEPVFDNALTALGLRVTNVNFENAIEKGTDPSPKVIRQMQMDLKHRRVVLFVNNKQVSTKTVSNMVQLAQQNRIPVLKVTETMPAKMTYQQWMLTQYRALSRLLPDK